MDSKKLFPNTVEKNIGADLFRVISLLLVVVYHAWVIGGSYQINNKVIYSFICLGGEIGVTAFFVLSGWGIYKSLERSNIVGRKDYIQWMKKRFVRIAPEYYISIMLVVFLGSGAVFLSQNGWKSLITTLLFIENLSPQFQAVSGVLWTMAITVQFYLIAPVIYRWMKKNAHITMVLIIVMTICTKHFLFTCGASKIPSVSAFYWSRQTLFSTLDNFALGMYVAYLGYSDKIKKWQGIVISMISVVGIYITCQFGFQYGIHTDNKSGLIWHSAIALCCAILLYNLILLDFKKYKIIRFFAKHQYGIYVIHLLIIQNLFYNSPIIQSINNSNPFLAIGVVTIIATGIGTAFSIWVSYAIIGSRK